MSYLCLSFSEQAKGLEGESEGDGDPKGDAEVGGL